MSRQPSQVARELFLAAVVDGPVDMPAAVQQMLQELSLNATLSLDTADLAEQVAEQLSIFGALYSAGSLDVEQADRRVSALRWVLQELRSWTPEVAQPWRRLRTLLAVLAVFDAANAGVSVLLQQEQLKASLFIDGLRRILEDAEAQQVRPNNGGGSWWSEVQAAGRDGDYGQLKTLTYRLDLNFQPDTRLAIYLLWRIQPDLLAELISRKQDVLFSYAVCNVLGDLAPELALGVDDITFKFFSVAVVSDVQPEHSLVGTVEVFCELLLQVARTNHWHSWLQAYYKHLRGNTVSEQALSISLGHLEARHWADFISAVRLWTLRGAAESMANILVPFHQAVGDLTTAKDMWFLAFQRWSQWDYGHEESGMHMFSPAACSFDFPVAMYYAHLPPEEVAVEEAKLIEALASVEQQWFSSSSDLITHRNRLLSRLRLVCHGKALASGTTKEALPVPIQPDGEYAASRYHYFDVNLPR